LATVRGALESLSIRDDELGKGLKNDRIAFGRPVAGLVAFGLIGWITGSGLSWGFIAAADLDILLVLLAVGFHGDTMYAPNHEPLKKHWITKWLYDSCPPKPRQSLSLRCHLGSCGSVSACCTRYIR
jgi:hypothetical protein